MGDLLQEEVEGLDKMSVVMEGGVLEDGVEEGEGGVGGGGVVDWSARALRTLPPTLRSLATVHHLYLQDNQLEALPLNLFPSLPLLERLDLRYNRLAGLPPLQGHTRWPGGSQPAPCPPGCAPSSPPTTGWPRCLRTCPPPRASPPSTSQPTTCRRSPH